MAAVSLSVAARPRVAGWVARLAVPIVGALLVLRFVTSSDAHATTVNTCIIYAVIALSLNAVVGYIGQLSLGHQGFVGFGSALTAYAATVQGFPFLVTLLVGLLGGALTALVMGVVALRISGLYLSLVTLVFGLTMQSSVFSFSSLSGNGAGQAANRPTALQSPQDYFYLCLGVLIVVLYVDRQLTRSKAGRALAAVKENERVAEAVGVDVTRYKLVAFTYSGAIAGLAGSLFAYSSQQFSGKVFDFPLALTFIAMTVVGGPGSRAGVVAGGALFAALNTGGLLSIIHTSGLGGQLAGSDDVYIPSFIGAVLLVLTLVVTPGGIAQRLDPVVRWVCGHPFSLHGDAGGPGAVDGSSSRA
jgi:branched-chain amino acid transport system permease protein